MKRFVVIRDPRHFVMGHQVLSEFDYRSGNYQGNVVYPPVWSGWASDKQTALEAAGVDPWPPR